MPVAESKPRFINAQHCPVGVYNETKKHIYVLPYRDVERKQKDGIYIVEGEWYKQFVHPAGPLVPFPETAAPVAPPVPVPVPKAADVPPKPLADEVGGEESTDATSSGDTPVGVVAGNAEPDTGDDKVPDDVPTESEPESESEPEPAPVLPKASKNKPYKHKK